MKPFLRRSNRSLVSGLFLCKYAWDIACLHTSKRIITVRTKISLVLCCLRWTSFELSYLFLRRCPYTITLFLCIPFLAPISLTVRKDFPPSLLAFVRHIFLLDHLESFPLWVIFWFHYVWLSIIVLDSIISFLEIVLLWSICRGYCLIGIVSVNL